MSERTWGFKSPFAHQFDQLRLGVSSAHATAGFDCAAVGMSAVSGAHTCEALHREPAIESRYSVDGKQAHHQCKRPVVPDERTQLKECLLPGGGRKAGIWGIIDSPSLHQQQGRR